MCPFIWLVLYCSRCDNTRNSYCNSASHNVMIFELNQHDGCKTEQQQKLYAVQRTTTKIQQLTSNCLPYISK